MRQDRILTVLRERERSIAWLGRKLGITRSAMHKKLMGRRTLTPAERERIAQILDVPVALLIPDGNGHVDG